MIPQDVIGSRTLSGYVWTINGHLFKPSIS
jgi:hypothetical protein